ncbi:MAG: tetratricopeptide (TPR) repeat protein [Rhodothermales bacterium]|jgi:tetratricopeptide (TPR) repeat protein
MRSRFLGISVGLFLLLAAPTFLVGCKSTSFVGKRYDNFTAYYNTFYNAKRSYRAGVKNRERRQDQIERTKFMGVFVRSGPAGGGRDFEEAVLKSADVLREHPQSKWVDDALLLIGKSYFYEDNFIGAQQKFGEAIDRETGLQDEARFWLARTYIASGDFKRGEDAIAVALGGEVSDRRWVASLHLALGELRVKEGNLELAAEDLEKGLAVVKDNEIAARAAFLLGQVLEKLERYPEAVEAYRRTLDYRPEYELSYAAMYSAVRVEGQYVDGPAALKALRKMERDDKHFAYRSELALVRGDILRAQGRADEAFSLYDELLYDPIFKADAARLKGQIHYSLAKLFRDLDSDYVSAAAHFDTASATLRSTGGSLGAPVDPLTFGPEAIRDAQELKDSFGAYATAYSQVYRLDSLLWLGEMDDSTFAAKVLELRQLRAEELAERKRLQEERQIARSFQQSASVSPLDNRGLPEGKILPNRNAQGGASGFLFHDDPVMMQEGQLSFSRKWGDRPLVNNWRRLEAVAGAEFVEEEDLEDSESELAPDQLPEIDTSGVPRDSLAQVEMRSELARSRYDLGTSLFLGINRPDSAAAWYRMVLEDTPEEPVARRALFALAEIQRALGDTLSASGIYQQMLVEYPDTEFAARIRTLLGIEDSDSAGPDSLEQAATTYAFHFDTWQSGRLEEAMNGMFTLAGEFASTDLVPKALFAAATVFMEWADRDSISVTAPMPIGVSDSLLVSAGVITPPLPEASPADTLAASDSLGAAMAASDSLGAAMAASDSLGAAMAASDSLGAAMAASDSQATDSLAVVQAPDSTRVVPAEEALETVDSSTADSVQVPVAPADSVGVGVATGLGVEADSTAAIAVADSLGSVVAVADVAVVIEPTVEARPWNELTLSGLLTTIRSRFAATPYASAAGQVIAALDAMKAEETARRDTLRMVLEAARTDSLAVLEAEAAVADSLAALAVGDDDLVAGADSSAAGGVVDEALNDPSLLLASDSLATASVDSLFAGDLESTPVDSLSAGDLESTPVDSLSAGALESTPVDSLSTEAPSEGAIDVPSKGRDPVQFVPDVAPSDSAAAVVRRGQPIGMAGARDAVNKVAEVLEEVESSSMEQPGTSEEEEDETEAWTGWTLVLSELPDMSSADVVQSNLAQMFFEYDAPEIWTGSWKDRDGVLVTLGRFETRAEALQFAGNMGSDLPSDAWLLHILPRD